MNQLDDTERIQSIGDVQLASSLGADAFSETFRGLIRSTRRPVFVRIFATEVAGHRLVPGRFLREFGPMRDLADPNLTEMIDFGIDGGMAFTVTAYAPASVAGLLRVYGPVHPRLAIAIVRQAALGLAAAHERILVHGQLHPGVLHLTQQPDFDNHRMPPHSVQVADVGLYYALAAYGFVNRVMDEAAWPYICPEVARGRVVDSAGDIYSLGHILIHLLHGQPMFTPTSREELRAPRGNEAHYQVAADHPDAPAVLQQAIERATARHPEQRHASMSAFVAALDTAVAQMDRIDRGGGDLYLVDDLGSGQPEVIYGHSMALAQVAVTQTANVAVSPQQTAAATALRDAVLATPPPPRPAFDEQPTEPERVSTVTVLDRERWDPPTRVRQRVGIALAVLLLVLLAGLWFAVGRGGSDDAPADDAQGGAAEAAIDVTATPDPALERANATLTAVAADVGGTRTANANASTTARAVAAVSATATATATATRTPTATATATATATPSPTATATSVPAEASPTDVTAVQPIAPVEPTAVPQPACAYTGPQFEGYTCSADGSFAVTLSACDLTYVSIDWGDGTSTQAGPTEPSRVFTHTFAQLATYTVGVEAGQTGGCSGVFVQTLIYEYAPPS